jgi:hypothetical protein
MISLWFVGHAYKYTVAVALVALWAIGVAKAVGA